jgi:hypothetical protein
MMSDTTTMTHDEGLAMLNDHIGEEVDVTVFARRFGDLADLDLGVMGASGTLTHWSARLHPELLARSDNDEVRSMYLLNDEVLVDLTEPEGLYASIVPKADGDEPPYAVEFDFGGTVVEITWGKSDTD